VSPRIRYTLFDQPNVVNLSPMTLSANEVRELDLTSIISSVANNQITDSGIEIEHTGQPGAVIIHAASVDQSGRHVFDVPVKDPKNMPFQGGSYPWSIEGDNRAVLHVKNIDAPTDGAKREFMVKLYFDGGEYNVPLQRIEAGQTGVVDIRKLRDDQVKDVLGNVIPLNVTGGQLAWYGRANKGEFIGRLAEYDPVAGTSSSFSCPQNCICTTGFFSGQTSPSVISDLIGHQAPLHPLETDADCNQANQFIYEIYNAIFSSSDTDVVTIDGYTATLVGPGTANISASWDTNTVEQQCTLASDGECIDARCPTNAVSTPIADTPVNVAPIRFVRVVTDYGNVDFTEGLTNDQYNATLQLGENSPICTGSTFSMLVRMSKGGNVTLFPPQDQRNIVDTPEDSQYRVNGGGLQEEGSNTPYFSISLKRINPGNPNRHIRTVVAGTSFAGAFSASGFVTIHCP